MLLLITWLLGAFLGLLPLPAGAAGVRLEVAAGFGGLARQGAWLPVRVTLTNDGADVQAVVRVRRAGDAGGPSVSQAVELPAGARKSVTLLLPLNEGFVGPLTVQALAGEAVLAQTNVEVAASQSGSGLIGVLAGPPEAAARVVAGLGGRGGANGTARLTPEDLPTNPYALTALDALVINGTSTRALAPAQIAALGEWVALGGTLVLGGGGAAAAVLEGLGDLPPVRLTGPAASVPRLPALAALTGTPVEASGPFVVAAATPLPTAAVLAAQEERPLVITRPLGHGRVSFVALDLGLDPFLGWTGSTRFWDGLVQPPDPGPERRSPAETGLRLRWALGSGTAIDLPSTGTLALLLLAYVIVIGPLNYLILRRLDRREWAWATVPLVTVLFTGSLFLVGAGARGGQVAVNSIGIVRSAASAPGAAADSYIGVFSPGRAVLSLRLPEGTLLTGTPDADRGPGGPLPALQLWQGGAAEARDVPFAAAEFKTFAAQGRLAAAPLTADLRLEGDRLVGTVRNTSEAQINDLVLLVGRQFTALGGLEPGGSLAVDWVVPVAPRSDGHLPLAAQLNGGRFPEGGGRDWRPQARFQVLELLYGFEAERSAASQVHVLGWQERPPLPLTVAGGAAREQAITLVQHSPAVLPGTGAVTVPAGLLPRTVEGGDQRMGPKGLGLALGPGETIVNFTLPGALAGIAAEEISLIVTVGEGPSAVALPAAAPPGTPTGMSPTRDPGLPAGAVKPGEAPPADTQPAATPTPAPAGATKPAGPPPAVAPAAPPGRPPMRVGVVRFSLYDWERGTWLELPQAGAGRTVVSDAHRFVSPAGPIRLRVEVLGAGDTLFLRQLDMGVRGRLR